MHVLPFLLLLSTFHIDYATFLGGSVDESAKAITVDPAGNVYTTGSTDSSDFPLTSTRFGVPSAAAACTFVSKLSPTASSIVWSVCLPNGTPNAIGVDGGGNVDVLAGASLVKLSPDASRMVYTKTLGSAGTALAVDLAGNAYVVGSATQGIATTPGVLQPNVAPGMCPGNINAPPSQCPDTFAMKIAPDGSTIYATYLGGAGPDQARAVAVDSQGNIWITGDTESPDFPVTVNALQSKFHGEVFLGPLVFGDAFVTELDPNGAKLLYSTYLGGSRPDAGLAIALDSSGSAYVAGATQSPDFPTKAGVLQPVYSGPLNEEPALFGNGFVAKFSAFGSLVYSTFVPDPQVSEVAVDARGDVYYEGAATSVLNADGSAILHSAPLTGLMAIDSQVSVYLAATTQGYIYFPSRGALQTKFGGGTYDASITKIDFSGPQSAWVSNIVNAASLRPGTPQFYPVFQVAPGEIVSVFGAGFDSSTRLLFDGVAAPILYVQANQINAVVPFEVNRPGTAMTLQADGETFGQGRMDVFEAVPGLFTLDASGSGQAAVLNQDGSVNSTSNPAPRGSIVSIFMTGSGRMTPAQADGSVTPLAGPFPQVALGVGSNIGAVTYAGAAPGLVAGAIQVNVKIFQDATTGDRVPLLIYVGNFVSGFSGDTTIAVR